MGYVCGHCAHKAETIEEVVAWYAKWVEHAHGRSHRPNNTCAVKTLPVGVRYTNPAMPTGC